MRVYRKLCSVIIILSLLVTPNVSASTSTTTTVAPNLMIIFSTAFSMNREMDDTSYPSLDINGDGVERDNYYRFDDLGYNQWNPAGSWSAPAPWNSSGTFLDSNLYGNQPSSKLYKSKEAFLDILNDPALSDNINIGFATFRQTFGLPMATTNVLTTATWPEVLPAGGNPDEDLSNRGDPADPASPHPDFPGGNVIFKASNPEKNAFGNDMTNFSSLRWWRQWFDWGSSALGGGANWNDWSNPGVETPCAYLYTGVPLYGNPAHGGSGGKYYETGRGFLDDGFTTFLDNNSGDGGLPLKFRYRAGAEDQVTGRTECSIDDTGWPWGVANNTGARSAAEVAAGDPMIEHYLCKTWYNSQGNIFQALYNSNRPYNHSYPGRWNGYDIYRATPELYLFDDSSGSLVDRWGINRSNTSYSLVCDANSLIDSSHPAYMLQDQTVRVTDQLRAWGPFAGESGTTTAYFSEVPHYWEGLYDSTTDAEIGAMTGWSGETSYERVCGGTSTDTGSDTNTSTDADTTECMTASYPSGVADPCADGRNLCPNESTANPADFYRYVKTMGADLPGNSRHMGVFLDLPDPALGYYDQREKVKGFMAYEQMSLDGNDYNPSTQLIAGGKGVAVSSHPWQQHQSPIYQSLQSAYAYYSAYKAADTLYDSCRDNNILLFYDGKEDARWEMVNGVEVYAKPEDMAAKLYNDLGVRVHVVIISNNSGDIDQANLIAASGGTTQAYSAQTLEELKNGLSTTFSKIGLSGEVSEVAPAIPTTTKAGSKVFLAGSEQSPSAGNLRAYEVGSDESLTLSWNAANEMTVAERKSRLWSTESDGELEKFKDLDDAAFEISGTPDADTIKEYTFDPSYDSEAYLMNRKSGSLLGAIERGNYTLALNAPSDPALWRDSDYRTFVTSRKNRTPIVLTSSVDGFLYAFKQSDGDLLWGWTPRSLVKHMKNFGTFQFGDYMNGRFYTVDAKKNSGSNYATYIIGAAQSGAMYYSLKLKNNNSGKLHKLIWEDEYAGYTSPGGGEPQLWRHDDKVYAVYVVNNGAGVSTLVIRNVAKKNDKLEVTGLSFKITSVPLISDKNEIYLGDKNGNVYRAELLDSDDALKTETALRDDLNATGAKLGNFVPSSLSSSELTYLGIATSTDGKRYLRTQSTSRLTIFREDYIDHDSDSDTDDVPVWRNAWTSSDGSAGVWSADGATYTADTSGTPGVDGNGYYVNQTSGIPALPSGARITDAATIVGDAVVLPVALAATSGVCSSLDVAYYYLYDLATGQFPAGKFGSRDNHIHAGFGKPNRVSVTTTGPNDIDMVPNAPQKEDNTTGVMDGIEVTGGQRSGRNSWRELVD